jgi:hypothetical protein
MTGAEETEDTKNTKGEGNMTGAEDMKNDVRKNDGYIDRERH